MARNKNKNRQSWSAKPSTPVIDAVATEAPVQGSPVGSPSQAGTKTEGPPQPEAKPVVQCSVAVHTDKVDVTGIDPNVAEILTGRMLGWNTTEVRLKDTKAIAFKIYSPIAKVKMGAAAKTWVAKWLARLGALCIWFLFVTYLFGEVGAIGWVLERVDVSASWEWVLLLAITSALVLGSSFASVSWSAKALAYVVFAPFLILGVLIAKLFGGFLLLARIVAMLSSLRVAASVVLFMLVACSVIAKATEERVLWAAFVMLAIGAVYLIASNFLWAASPLETLFRLLGWLEAKSHQSMNEFKQNFGPSVLAVGKGGKEAESALTDLAKLFGKAKGWVWAANLVRTRLKQFFAPLALFHLFALRFLISLALVLLAFGAFYLAIAKMDSTAFAGAGIKGFGDGVYFSVGTFFTASFGDVIPASAFAKWTVVCQIAVALVMLTLLALSFSTLSIQRTTESSARLEKRAEDFIAEMEKQLGTHYALSGRDIVEVLRELEKNPRSRWKGYR